MQAGHTKSVTSSSRPAITRDLQPARPLPRRPAHRLHGALTSVVGPPSRRAAGFTSSTGWRTVATVRSNNPAWAFHQRGGLGERRARGLQRLGLAAQHRSRLREQVECGVDGSTIRPATAPAGSGARARRRRAALRPRGAAARAAGDHPDRVELGIGSSLPGRRRQARLERGDLVGELLARAPLDVQRGQRLRRPARRTPCGRRRSCRTARTARGSPRPGSSSWVAPPAELVTKSPPNRLVKRTASHIAVMARLAQGAGLSAHGSVARARAGGLGRGHGCGGHGHLLGGWGGKAWPGPRRCHRREPAASGRASTDGPKRPASAREQHVGLARPGEPKIRSGRRLAPTSPAPAAALRASRLLRRPASTRAGGPRRRTGTPAQGRE